MNEEIFMNHYLGFLGEKLEIRNPEFNKPDREKEKLLN